MLGGFPGGDGGLEAFEGISELLRPWAADVYQMPRPVTQAPPVTMRSSLPYYQLMMILGMKIDCW